MTETRKLAAIVVADVVGYGRLAGADEERTLARLRALRSDLIDPTIALHNGRIVKRAGDGSIIEFRSVVDAVRCAIEVQRGMVERNAGVPPERRIEFRVGIHLGDVVEEADGDLMGDGVNVAARLEGICEPGGISLSGAAHEQVRDRLKETFIDLGEKQLKNIARPVRVFALSSARSVAPEGKAPAPQHREPPRFSIVVLPFANIGGDPEQEYFVDGVTESLTTDLSRISGAFVIGRQTAFTYKGKAVDLKQIGRDLNVLYVLEGSVQRGGNRMRVNVQLIDAETGSHLWGERFDKPVADLFDMQDEIVARLANQLLTELVFIEARRAERAPHPDSGDLVLQGWDALRLGGGAHPDQVARARGFFERALELSPENVDALIGAGTMDVLDGWSVMRGDPGDFMPAAEARLTKALSLAPNHPHAHTMMGLLLCLTNRPARGIEELERALAIDPNLAAAHGYIGFAHSLMGRAQEQEAHAREALRLSPHDGQAWSWFLQIGGAKAYLGEFEGALPWLRKSIDTNRNNPWGFLYLAASLAHLGRFDEARREVQAGLAVNPNFTIKRYRAHIQSDNAVYLAQRERVAEGMRMAGVPEE
jgi:TolB-like protein/class 3 adenylate cyclase/Flp pilus assembly protein TadD